MIKVFDSFDDLEREWADLLERAAFATVFQTYEWNATWWKHLKCGEKPVLVACYQGGKLTGLAPLMEYRVKVKGIPAYGVFSFIGHPDSDYLDFLLDAQQGGEALGEIIRWCLDNTADWRVLELPEMRENSPTIPLLSRALSELRWPYRIANDSVCPGLETAGQTMKGYLDSLSYETRKKTRKNVRRLERDRRVEYVVGGPESIDIFFSLNKGRWAARNMPGSIKTEEVRSFNAEVTRKLAGHLNLGILQADGKPIAVQYSYDFRGERCVYLQGMETGHEYYSPGIVLMMNRIEDAMSRGYRYYDLMRGEEAYKFQYMKTVRRNRRFHIAKDRLKLGAFLAIEGLSTRLLGKPVR